MADCDAAVCAGECVDGTCAPSVSAVVLGLDTSFANYRAETGKCEAVCPSPRGFRMEQDQPYCVLTNFRRGRLGHCSAGANATRTIETLEGSGGVTLSDGVASLFEGPANPWRDDQDCDDVAVYACDPLTDPDPSTSSDPDAARGPEDLCGQWDFFEGDKATTILVRAGSGSDTDVPNQQATDESRTHEWAIFETGPETRNMEGEVTCGGLLARHLHLFCLHMV